jgi:hypothetical protein
LASIRGCTEAGVRVWILALNLGGDGGAEGSLAVFSTAGGGVKSGRAVSAGASGTTLLAGVAAAGMG